MTYADYVIIFKALADETRLKIVELLCGGELCACKILENFNFTQPTLSYHMKTLCDSGLVEGRRDGAWMRYQLNDEKLEILKEFLNHLKPDNSPKQNDGCCSEK